MRAQAARLCGDAERQHRVRAQDVGRRTGLGWGLGCDLRESCIWVDVSPSADARTNAVQGRPNHAREVGTLLRTCVYSRYAT